MILALSAHWAALRSLAGAGVGVGSLTATRQPAPMTEPAVATEVHQPLDVHVDLTTKVAFDLEVLVDALADLLDVGLVEIVSTLALRNPRSMYCSAITVCFRPGRSTPAIRAISLLSLPLLVTGVVTQDAHDTFAAHYLALLTNLSDAWSNLHVSFSLIRPLVGS
jgi:hypothetical protein